MTGPWRVTVLRGGPSREREVSLASGAAVADACRRLGHRVTESDIGPEDLRALEIPADLVFPVLHGWFGEDGQLQAILEARRIAYVGSDAAASHRAMDKGVSKTLWREAGLPTADWAVVDEHTGLRAADLPGPPAVVKPVREGSSIGVVFCESRGELEEAVGRAVSEHNAAIVEERLNGPELTVGILGHEALPVIEIQPALAFYNFEAKYCRDDTQYLDQPRVDRRTYRAAQETAIRAFDVLGCRDLARVDFIADRRRGLQLLEINTLPGFTDHSLLPKAAARVGIGFDPLVARLLQFARQRAAGPSP